MRTKVYSIVVCIVFILFSGIRANAQKNNTSIFWEVSGNGLEKPSYLYGTMHMLAQDDFFLLDSLEEHFTSCKQIILEVDMDAPDFMQRTQKLMFMSDNSIHDFLNDDDYKVMEQFFKDSLGIPLTQFQHLKPFFLTQFIIPKIINKPIASYERTFVQMAQNNQIDLIGIESIEEQMNSLDQIPFDKQAALVMETIHAFDENRELFGELTESYKNKDFVDFYELMFNSSKELVEFEQLLLTDRNKKWIPRIEEKIKKHSCFIAVGALHLEGDNGVVELLKLKGYKVKPI